jgi:DNA-binding CsgD family transcriptional regulator/tetratricopeptide (TPR) repeat protein
LTLYRTGIDARCVENGPLIARDAERDLIRGALSARTGAVGVLIVGTSGVGKTRLAREALAGARHGAAMTLVGTAAAQRIPLAPLLAAFPDLTPSPDQSIVEVRARLSGARTRPVVLVDDAHWLDEATQTLLYVLISAREVRAVVTASADFPIPSTIVDLWKNGQLTRVDLEPLDPGQSRVFVEAMVGAPVTAAVAAHLHTRSRGLPLALRELVTAAVAARALVVSDGLGRAVRSLPPSRRLRDVVAANLSGHHPDVRSALDVVALAEPVPLRLLLRLVDRQRLDLAERAGLIAVSTSWLSGGDRDVVTAGHPLYAEIALAGLGRVARRDILGRLVTAAGELPGAGEALALRVAAWCLETGQPVPVDDLLTAARLAHRALDPELAGRFVGELWRRRPDFDTGLLYATTLARQQRYESSLELLRRMAGCVRSEEDATTRVSMINEILARLGRHDEAMAELLDAEATVHSRKARAHLVARRAFTANLAGRTRAGLALIDPLLGSGDPDERQEAEAYAVVMLALDGRAEEALALADDMERRAEVDVGRDEDRLAPPRQMRAVQRGYALLYAGHLARASAWAVQGVRMAEEHGSGYLLATWLNLAARVELERGDAGAALLPLGRLIAETPQVGGGAQRALAHSALIEAHGLLGQVDAARQALVEVTANPGNVPWHPAGSAQIAAALLAFAEGDPNAAVDRFEDGYRRAAPTNASIALFCAHAVARYGQRARGLFLAREVGPVQGPLPALRLAHLEAIDAGDLDELFRIGAEYLELGADLLAGEAYGLAAALATTRGDRRRATAAATAGRPVAGRLAGVRTPDLIPLTLGASVRLTPREREIAVLAANGSRSPEIAASLVLSVRTVDNHLQNVYRKLGTRSRRELRRVLGEQEPD